MSCCNDCENKQVSQKLGLRIVGCFLIVSGIVEFGMGGFVYGFFIGLNLGAWWGGILVVTKI